MGARGPGQSQAAPCDVTVPLCSGQGPPIWPQQDIAGNLCPAPVLGPLRGVPGACGPPILSIRPSPPSFQEPVAKFSLKEIQSTRTQRPTAGSSYPYVEITLGDLLAQGITQLQLEQVGGHWGDWDGPGWWVVVVGTTTLRLGGPTVVTTATHQRVCPPPASAGPGAVPRGGRAHGEAAGCPGEEVDAAAQRDHPALSPPWTPITGGGHTHTHTEDTSMDPGVSPGLAAVPPSPSLLWCSHLALGFFWVLYRPREPD